MSTDAQAIFFALSLLCFTSGAIWHINRSGRNAFPTVLLFIGLAFWVFVPFWIAFNA